MWFITIFITHIHIFVFNLTHAAEECLKHETIYYKDLFTHKDKSAYINGVVWKTMPGRVKLVPQDSTE